jgi:uncharacterized protein (DUF2236 family)
VSTSPFELVDGARRTLGAAIFQRVAGPDGAAVRQRLREAGEDRWFPLDSPISRVHSNTAMFVGGLSALLLQSLHPLAMAGVEEHSGFRGDPWGRLARTSHFLAVTTFGSAADAEAEIAKVRAVHERVRGRAPDGRPYVASDPHLLSWVHIAEVDSFLRAHQRFGDDPLTDSEADEYVGQAARVASELGATDVPTTTAELKAALDAYRPELCSTPAARATARYLVANPPLPLALRGLYLPLAGAAVALLPRWARWPLRLPWLPVTEATLLRAGGQAVTRTIRWALPAGIPATEHR